MIVPLAYWPAMLQLRWGDLDEICSTRPVTSTARQIAIEAEKGPPPPEVVGDVAVVRITDAAAQEILAQVARLRAESLIALNQATYFSIGIHTAGAEAGRKYATLALEYDAAVETCVESNGIQVLLRIDQLERMRGTVVDFRNSLYGAGFTIDS